ncbi:Mannose-6-phosphate isomerase, partial [Phlyctochytrium bullatum]
DAIPRQQVNWRLKQVDMDNAVARDFDEFCQPVINTQGRGLLLHRDVNSANNMRNIGLRYMENRGERFAWNLGPGWNPPLADEEKYMYRLKYTTQSYDWGKLGDVSKVAEFATSDPAFKPALEQPYAELWMGTHPNGPSTLFDHPEKSLKSILTPQNLSTSIAAKYEGDLPFLFKILSIRKALSIQAHPDKTLAKELFERFPKIYKDPNHKPEMAVALTPFEAFIGFRPLSSIAANLEAFPEFKTLLSPDVVQQFLATHATPGKEKEVLRALFKSLMESDQGTVAAHIQKLVARLAAGNVGAYKKGSLEELVLRLNEQFPDDIGIFCAFFLNYVELKKGEAIFLAANEPHAYLSGDCVECMAASDNVVRSGLTPKFKDVDTLIRMLTYNHGTADSQVLRGEPFKSTKFSRLYDPPIEEFSIVQVELAAGATDVETHPPIDGPSVLIVTDGEGEAVVAGKAAALKKGFVFFVEAGVDVTFKGSAAGLNVFRAYCTI